MRRRKKTSISNVIPELKYNPSLLRISCQCLISVTLRSHLLEYDLWKNCHKKTVQETFKQPWLPGFCSWKKIFWVVDVVHYYFVRWQQFIFATNVQCHWHWQCKLSVSKLSYSFARFFFWITTLRADAKNAHWRKDRLQWGQVVLYYLRQYFLVLQPFNCPNSTKLSAYIRISFNHN